MTRLRVPVFALAVCAIGAAVAGCGSSQCAYCDDPDCANGAKLSWNVELREAIVDPCTGAPMRSFMTMRPPLLLVREGRDSIYRVRVPCFEGETCTGATSIDLPADAVVRATSVSDPVVPPKTIAHEMACLNCERDRRGLLVFDKVELRAMGGWRGTQTAVFYPNETGGTLYEPKSFGFDRGGTTYTVGGEAAFLWDVYRISTNAMLHLGPLTGVWPVDGSTFVPVSVHPRVTFNNRPDPYGCNCDAWYLFGDAGLALDGRTGAPLTPIFEKRFFYGVGAGYEMPVSRGMDLAIDVLYRRLRLPLPPIDCCPDVPADLRNPLRLTHVFGLRLGVTF